METRELIRQIQAYEPFNAQEEADRLALLELLRQEGELFLRGGPAHMTASAWVVNKSRTKTLMVYHNIYRAWSWMGGHADGERDLLSVALREVREESGICHLRPVTADIFSLEILTVDGHEKRGQYVSSHLHLNVTYLLEAEEGDPLTVRPEENSGVQWVPLDEALTLSTEPWFCQRIYAKLNEKLRRERL